ncbi:MAG: hypothetical protein NT067_02965 [Candidatus Diapherotrites archaeon]|nr:hypothetical protein [Candidatus Diapherotrites archaeon]
MIDVFAYLKARKKAQDTEKELPFALMHLRTRLALGEQFEEALAATAATAKGALGREFAEIGKEISLKGASAEEAFLHSMDRVDSLQYRRACSHLAGLYEQGFSGKELRSLDALHREIVSVQRAKLKEFSGKMAVFSLLFVTFSTVLPALFLALILVGSMFLELDVSPSSAFLLVIVLFPAIDIAMLLFIREKTPAFARP